MQSNSSHDICIIQEWHTVIQAGAGDGPKLENLEAVIFLLLWTECFHSNHTWAWLRCGLVRIGCWLVTWLSTYIWGSSSSMFQSSVSMVISATVVECNRVPTPSQIWAQGSDQPSYRYQYVGYKHFSSFLLGNQTKFQPNRSMHNARGCTSPKTCACVWPVSKW